MHKSAQQGQKHFKLGQKRRAETGKGKKEKTEGSQRKMIYRIEKRSKWKICKRTSLCTLFLSQYSKSIAASSYKGHKMMNNFKLSRNTLGTKIETTRVLTSTLTNSFGMNWNTNCEPNIMSNSLKVPVHVSTLVPNTPFWRGNFPTIYETDYTTFSCDWPGV